MLSPEFWSTLWESLKTLLSWLVIGVVTLSALWLGQPILNGLVHYFYAPGVTFNGWKLLALLVLGVIVKFIYTETRQ
jgi:hypothetical protein